MKTSNLKKLNTGSARTVTFLCSAPYSHLSMYFHKSDGSVVADTEAGYLTIGTAENATSAKRVFVNWFNSGGQND